MTVCILTSVRTDVEGWMRVSIKVKGLQDAVSFSMGAFGEDEGVGAPHTHCSSHQPQSPGQSSMVQRGNFDTITAGYHHDGRKQRDRNDHEPHFKISEEERKTQKSVDDRKEELNSL